MNSNESRCIITKSVDLKNYFKSPSQRRYSDFAICGGMFSDFELAWLYNGPMLKIFHVTNGTVVSSWDFTTVTHDNRTEITSIIEYSVPESINRNSMRENQLYFIVSYTSRKDANKASFISLCHPRTSRILHTITAKEKITCLSLITAKKDHSSPITGLVKSMCGALAAGTTAGNLLIVDIKEIFTCARQGCVDRKQNRFSEMVIVDFKHNDINIKEKLNKSDEFHHIAVSLSISDKKGAEDSDSKITALMYIPQCTMLAVGLQNGIFQLWDVCTLKRLHRSSTSGLQTPVVKFGFQEPCNDPQSFCYLWVLYESQTEQNDCLPFAIMYACLFKKITTAPEYGIHYKNFMHCKKRFDLDVDLERSINGRCIACNVVSNTPSNILRHVTSVEDDASKINLFVIVFETWEQISDCNSCVTLIIFDMNQWYKAQMPQVIYQGNSVPFVSFQILEHLSERKGTVMDMRIKKDTIQQFLSFNLSEEYSYPSSLSFDTLVLTDSKLIHARVPGAQRNVLDKIVTEGPSGIINPHKYFSECKDVGLYPCFWDTYSHMFVPNQVQQRNFILTVLLEHKFSSFLVSCVKQWADGSRGVSGCTLPNLIKWAWDCVTRIKQLTDTVCIPLFDYSGDDLDRENYQKLKHCVKLMHTIRDLLAYILKNYKQYLLEDVKPKHQVDALKLVTKYFDVIIWCLDCSLLPEKVTSSSEKCVPTYMMSLMQYTEQRREELSNLFVKDQYFLTESTTLYIIDSILEQEFHGKKMQSQWEQESGGLSNGLYPPVTLQSLLRMFLMPGLSNDTKHFIMIYFLLDVCDYHRDEDMKEQLLSFSVVFSVDPTFLSLVQACWFLDHEKFEDAAGLLLNDSIISQLKNRRELYRTLMLACVCQGQYQLALRIERLSKLSRTVFNDDIFRVTLLLLNGLVMDAYFTVKENTFKRKGLLRHFFKVCDNLGYLKELFKFPLSSEEEEEFITYLDGCCNKDAGDLKVMYFLSRGRYVEAIDVNHQLGSVVPKFGVVGQETIKQKTNIGRTTTRDLLVNAFSKTLPAVTNDLINFCRKERNKIARFKTVPKPTPLSVVVHTDTSHRIPIYKSSFESFMEAAICKTAETWGNVPEILKRKRGQIGLKNTPFLRSNFITPCKSAVLFSERESDLVTKENKKSVDVDEPLMKRVRKNISVSGNKMVDEMLLNNESDKLTNAAEMNKILCTPHIQKRLNKLLQNTPDSSPLTSILKSSESRFKQPQKVGFHVPEADVRRSARINMNQSKLSPSPEMAEVKGIKSKMEVVTKPPLDSYISPIKLDSCVNRCLNTSVESTGPDSFYSLDSDHDNEPEMIYFYKEGNKPALPSNIIIEAMSEDDEISSPHTYTLSKCAIESMSEEEIPQAKHASKRILEHMSGKEISKPTCALDFNIKGASKEETLLPTRLDFNESTSEESQQICVEVHSLPSLPVDSSSSGQIISISTVETFSHLNMNEKDVSSFAVLQPLKECPILNQINNRDEQDSKVQFNEEFSTNTYEKETVIEQDSEEIQDTILDDDSDIEILADSSPIKPIEEEDFNDAATETNENLSERTYESDYSYSNESTHISDVEEEEEEEEEELKEIKYEDICIQEDDEELNEEQEAEEEEYDNDNKEEEEEKKKLKESVLKVQSLSNKEIDNVEDEGNEKEIINQDVDIDYDSLKKIMNAVNAAEASKAKSLETNLSHSSLCNETTTSVYEVMDIGSSTMIEEMAPNCSSVSEHEKTDSSVKLLNESQNMSVEVLSASCVDTDETVGEPQDISVEVLSMSCIDKEKTSNEPQLVFYFGENSVTSISEKLLGDESINEHQLEVSKNVPKVIQKIDDFSIVAVTEEENEENNFKDSLKEPETQNLSSSKKNQSSSKIMPKIDILTQSTSVQTEGISDIPTPSKIPSKAVMMNFSPKETSSIQTDDIVKVTVPHSSPARSPYETIIIGSSSLIEGGSVQTNDITKVTIPHQSISENLRKGITVDCHSLMEPQLIESDNVVEVIISHTSSSRSPSSCTPLQSSPMHTDDVTQMMIQCSSPSKNQHETVTTDCCSPVQLNFVQTDDVDINTSCSSRFMSPGKAATLDRHSLIQPSSIQTQKKVSQINVPCSSPSKSPSKAITMDSYSLVAPISSEENLVAQAKTHSPGSSKLKVHQSPAKKTESECSFTISIPDSPMKMAEVTSSTLEATPSRRSARIARRQSTDNIPQIVGTEQPSVVAHAIRKCSTDSVEAASMKSNSSVAESVTSCTSKSSIRKRSFSRLEMWKSSVKPQFKQLEVIMSDEELAEVHSASEEEDPLSSTSKTSTHSQKSSCHSPSSKLNTAVLQTPSPPPKKSKSQEFISNPTTVSQKITTESENYQNYTDSRRLTRRQKSLLEYGIARFPQSVESSIIKSLGTVEAEDSQGNLPTGKTKQLSGCARASARSSKVKAKHSTKSSRKLNREEAAVQAGSDSSDNSTYSKTSNASRCSKSKRRSTYTGTHLELRRSSVRPQFKPLSMVPSDEESISASLVGDESQQTSPLSLRSQTTRSMTRTRKNESEQSDHESLHSDLSESLNHGVRRTRRSIVLEEVAKSTPVKSRKSVSSLKKRK